MKWFRWFVLIYALVVIGVNVQAHWEDIMFYRDFATYLFIAGVAFTSGAIATVAFWCGIFSGLQELIRKKNQRKGLRKI